MNRITEDKKYWLEMAEKEPAQTLGYVVRYVKEPYAAEVIKKAAEKAPWTALELANHYPKEPYGR